MNRQGAAGHALGRHVFNVLYLLTFRERQQGVEQAYHQMGMLTEYLLESQVGFRVMIRDEKTGAWTMPIVEAMKLVPVK